MVTDNSYPLNLTRYINNPLIPIELVRKMASFISNSIIPVPAYEWRDIDFILMLDELYDEGLTPKYKKEEIFSEIASSLMKHSEFVKAISELINILEKWCKSNGIKSINFRDVNNQKIFS